MLVIPHENKLTLQLSLVDDFDDITTRGLEDFGLYLYTSVYDGHTYLYDKSRDLVFLFTDCDNNMIDDLTLDLQLFEGLTLTGEPVGLSDVDSDTHTETLWEAIIAAWALQDNEEMQTCEA